MSAITTHILDTSKGKPVAGVDVQLEFHDTADTWTILSHKKTNSDGRIKDFLSNSAEIKVGIYRLKFHVLSYAGGNGFYPEISIVFRVENANDHYHIPLLLNPYGYSTYRGS